MGLEYRPKEDGCEVAMVGTIKQLAFMVGSTGMVFLALCRPKSSRCHPGNSERLVGVLHCAERDLP